MSEILRIENLSKVFKVRKGFFRSEYIHALSDINLSIYKGEILCIVGESGSGKSTLGKIILRLERPTGGRILYKGEDIFSLGKEYTKKVSVIFQDPRNSLNPRMKVKEILEDPLIVHGIKNRKEIVEKTLLRVKLTEDFLERKPDDLSGGQRQRVAIARALILEPELIVADEPTASLDVSIQEEILKLFLELKNVLGISFIFITHDIRVVEKIADRVLVLFGGKIMELGGKEEVIKRPMHPYTKFLLNNVPVRHPRLRRSEEFIEEDYKIPYNGCPFRNRCPEATGECFKTLRRVEVDGRVVYCNVY